MRFTTLLSILIFIPSYYSLSQNRGCDAPPAESIIVAKVFDVDGNEKHDQACTHLTQIHKLKSHVDTNSTEGTTRLNWVIELEPDDYLALDLKFAAYDMDCFDSAGYISLKKGAFTHFEHLEYTVQNGAYTANGYQYMGQIKDETKLVINGPVMWKPIIVQVRRKTASTAQIDSMDQTDEQSVPFVVQNMQSDMITINFVSDATEEIYLYSAQGNLVDHFEAESGSSYDLSNYTDGVYYVCANVNGKTITGKCLKF